MCGCYFNFIGNYGLEFKMLVYLNFCFMMKDSHDWYCIAKTKSEREALKYGENSQLDVLTLCPSFILGPLLQPTMNASTHIFIELFKGISLCKGTS